MAPENVSMRTKAPNSQLAADRANPLRSGLVKWCSFALLFTCWLGCVPKPSTVETNDGERGQQAGILGNQQGQQTLNLPFSTAIINRWEDLVTEMTSVLKLDDHQQKTIKLVIETEVANIKAWIGENGSVLKDLDQRVIDAAKSRDLGEMRKLVEQGVSLKQEVTALYDGYKQSVLQALPEEKRNEWQAHLLLKRFNDLVDELELSPDQEEAIGRLAVSAAAKSGGLANWEGDGILQLRKMFEQQVLEADQMEAWESLNKNNPLRWLPTGNLWD